MGRGYPPPLTNYGIWGSIVSCPSGVQGRDPAENYFGEF